MVVVVAAVLSFAASSLKKIQAENVKIEKMSDILNSIGHGEGIDTAPDKTKYVNEQYAKYITGSFAINVKGDIIEGVDAFNLLINLKAEYDKPAEERLLPIFVSKNDKGENLYVIPVWGKGLWGPVWGYVALAANLDTIKGVVLDHKSETPGLGAEISTTPFEEQFTGKQILNADGSVVSVKLKKGGADDSDPYAVDAISGGTLTCRGVEDMLKNCLTDYDAYIKKQRAEQHSLLAPAQDSTALLNPTDSLTINQKGNE